MATSNDGETEIMMVVTGVPFSRKNKGGIYVIGKAMSEKNELQQYVRLVSELPDRSLRNVRLSDGRRFPEELDIVKVWIHDGECNEYENQPEFKLIVEGKYWEFVGRFQGDLTSLEDGSSHLWPSMHDSDLFYNFDYKTWNRVTTADVDCTQSVDIIRPENIEIVHEFGFNNNSKYFAVFQYKSGQYHKKYKMLLSNQAFIKRRIMNQIPQFNSMFNGLLCITLSDKIKSNQNEGGHWYRCKCISGVIDPEDNPKLETGVEPESIMDIDCEVSNTKKYYIRLVIIGLSMNKQGGYYVFGREYVNNTLGDCIIPFGIARDNSLTPHEVTLTGINPTRTPQKMDIVEVKIYDIQRDWRQPEKRRIVDETPWVYKGTFENVNLLLYEADLWNVCTKLYDVDDFTSWGNVAPDRNYDRSVVVICPQHVDFLHYYNKRTKKDAFFADFEFQSRPRKLQITDHSFNMYLSKRIADGFKLNEGAKFNGIFCVTLAPPWRLDRSEGHKNRYILIAGVIAIKGIETDALGRNNNVQDYIHQVGNYEPEPILGSPTEFDFKLVTEPKLEPKNDLPDYED